MFYQYFDFFRNNWTETEIDMSEPSVFEEHGESEEPSEPYRYPSSCYEPSSENDDSDKETLANVTRKIQVQSVSSGDKNKKRRHRSIKKLRLNGK